jgi:hypothetical protein
MENTPASRANKGLIVTAPVSIDLIAAARPNFMKIAPL